MFCFGLAGGYLLTSGVRYSLGDSLAEAVLVAALLGTGVGLKAIALQRWGEK